MARPRGSVLLRTGATGTIRNHLPEPDDAWRPGAAQRKDDERERDVQARVAAIRRQAALARAMEAEASR